MISRKKSFPSKFPQKKGKPPKIFDKDEHFRPGMTIEAMRDLPPAFVPKIGKVTAANASGINDGASAMLIMSAEKAKELGLKPLARIKAFGRGGCHPQIMGVSPVPAVNYLYKNSGLKLADFELIERQRSLRQPVSCLRKRTGPQQRNHQCQRIGYRHGPSGWFHRMPHHGYLAVCNEETRQDSGIGHHLRRRRCLPGRSHRNAVIFSLKQN